MHLLEHRHRITKRFWETIFWEDSLRPNPQRGNRLAVVLLSASFPLVHISSGVEKKTAARTARQAFPDNFESRWLPLRAMISTWMGRLRLQQSELSACLHPILRAFTAMRKDAAIARSTIIQASLAKGFSLHRGSFVRNGKEERTRLRVHLYGYCNTYRHTFVDVLRQCVDGDAHKLRLYFLTRMYVP